jgi:hypothetical protein
VDSIGTVKRITISDRGVVVERHGDRDTSWTDRRRHRDHWRYRERVRIGSGVIDHNDEGAGIVRIWSDAYVPAGQRVDDDVVAVFGSVRVDGEVSGDVVAVFGSVHLGPKARIGGDAVSIGGTLDQAEGATIAGESVSLGMLPFTWGLPGLSVLLISIVAGWLVAIFVGWIFVLLFPTVMLRVATVVERRPAASFFLGLLSMPMFVVALVLVFITVIGIPIGILLPMAYALMGFVGQLAATCVLGARLSRRSLSSGLMLPLFVGTLFIAVLLAGGAVLAVGRGFAHPAALFLSLFGVLLLLGLGALGTGAFLLSRLGTRPREVVWHTSDTPTSPAPFAGPVAPTPSS